MQDPYDLLPLAYRAASRVLRNRLLIEEAGERAVHALAVAMLEGKPPQEPRAWVWAVAHHSACALLRSDWVRTPAVQHEEIASRPKPYQLPRSTQAELVRERCEACLTPRQQDALHAMLSNRSTRAAARSCGMQPRDFRRYLQRIISKARLALAGHTPDDPHADDPAVQFRLPS